MTALKIICDWPSPIPPWHNSGALMAETSSSPSFYEPPNYSEELTSDIIQRYKSGETLEEIASAVGKTPNSVRGKLVAEGVYTQFNNLNLRASQINNSNPEQIPVLNRLYY